MQTRRIILCFLGLLIASLTCASQQAGKRSAMVHIILVSLRGDDLGTGTVASFKEENDGSRDLAPRFNNNTASNVPFGTYHLRAFKKGFSSSYRTVSVHQSEVWVVVQLNVGVENGPLPYTVSGTVEWLRPPMDNLWVRAQGLYSEVIADTRVEENGNFQLAGLPAGIYILSTRQGNRVLDIRSVAVPPPEQKEGTVVPVLIKVK